MDNIAIVGMGCLYPDYVTKEDFWDKVMAGEAFTSTNQFNGRAIERASIDPKRSDKVFGKYFSQQENELRNN